MRWKHLVPLLALFGALPVTSHAQGQFVCGTGDTNQVVQINWIDFSPYRRGLYGQEMSARDIEFQWDPLYSSTITPDAALTLDKFLHGITETPGLSPLAPEANTLQATYNYFRRMGADWNTSNPWDSTSLRVGHGQDVSDLGGTKVSQYTNADRAHVDAYIADPSRMIVGGRPVGGVYPSAAFSPTEDLSTGHASGEVRHRNSIGISLPANGAFLDPAGTGWTSPYRYRRTTVFAHEFQHSLQQPVDPSHPDSGSANPTGDLDELWSAGAEIVAGTLDTVGVRYEVPYTWPFLSNYQQRTSFMAYIGYNFLNEDQTRSLSGMRDDLMFRWSRGDRRLTGLRERLGDDSCWTCAQKSYFRPNQQSLADGARFALLHHNWRVASFVNSPTLDAGEFGFPAWSGFSHGHTLKAWQDCAGGGSDDLVALPPIVTIGPRQATRETTFAYQRSFRGGTESLILQPMGSNYWVIRADPALWSQNRDLVVRVSPRARFLHYAWDPWNRIPPYKQLRLMASIVGYNTADPGGDESDLWKLPGNAVYASPVTWVDTDSLSSDLEVVLPSFGLTHKAAVLVLTLGDEHGDWIGSNSIEASQAQPYRLDVNLKPSGADGQLPVAFSATPGNNEDFASWSPAGDELVFMAKLPQFSNATQIYRQKLDGSGLTRLAPQANQQYAPDWSPRGNLIAFEGVTESGDSRIWMVNLDTPWNGPYDVTNLPGVETRPSFQPNGQGLAFIHVPPFSETWELRWAAYDGTGSRVVATFQAPTPVAAIPRPAWNPSGTRIYLTLNDSLYSVPVGGGSLTLDREVRVPANWVDFHPGVGRVLVGTTMRVPNQADYQRTFPADPVFDQTPYRIALVDTAAATRDTSFRYAVRFPNEALHPRYSPDGTRIAYTLRDINDSGDLYIGRITPNHAPVLSPIEDVGEPACVPLLFQFPASDPDGEPLAYKADYLPPGAGIVSGNWFRWQSPVEGEYYVVLRALDGSGGVASQVVRLNIFDDGSCYEALGEGGGGAGGFSQRQAGANRLIPSGTTSTPIVNSLLDGAHPGEWIEQVARLGAVITNADGTCQTSLLAKLAGTTTIDRAGLIAVDHPEGTAAFATPGGILVGHRQVVTSAIDADGADLRSRMGSDDTPVTVLAGSTIDVTMAEGAREGLVLDCARLGKPASDAESGIEVSIEENGAWRVVGQLDPRLRRDQLAAATDNAAHVRLSVSSDTQVWGIEGITSAGLAPGSVEARTLGAVASEPEAGVAALAAADESVVALGNSQSLALTFSPPALADGQVRSCFVSLRAMYSLEQVGATRSQSTETALPLRFALSNAQPNPFDGSTRFRFEVPRTAELRIEAFDVLGRRIRTLASGRFGAGEHTVAWDGKGDDGGPSRPGVYLVRLTAPGFTAQQRVVLLAR